jgi:hypothetical protein
MMAEEECECICNHSGACTGCGKCWMAAYTDHLDRQIRAFFGLPGGLA